MPSFLQAHFSAISPLSAGTTALLFHRKEIQLHIS